MLNETVVYFCLTSTVFHGIFLSDAPLNIIFSLHHLKTISRSIKDKILRKECCIFHLNYIHKNTLSY